MNNFDYTNLTTRELLEKAMNGEIPIPRNNPKLGESKYFFMKMGSDPYASISDAETFDVPDDVDPFEFRDNGYSAPLSSSLDTPLTNSGDSWLDSSDYTSNETPIMPRNWSTAQEGKSVYEDFLRKEGKMDIDIQNPIDFAKSALMGGIYAWELQDTLKKQNMIDKFKHALINCKVSQYGHGGHAIVALLSDLKELNDVYNLKSNTLDESMGDDYANRMGQHLGIKYPSADCETLLKKYIQKY